MPNQVPKKYPKQASTQVHIFYGEDDFSLLAKVKVWKEEFAKKYSQQAVIQLSGEGLSESEIINRLLEFNAPSLFATTKLVVCKNCLPTKAGQEALSQTIVNLVDQRSKDSFFIFYSTQKLDRRLTGVKNVLNSGANIVEFTLPHGINLNAWIKAYSKQQGIAMDDAAVEKLAQYLGRDLFEEKKFGGKVVERKEAFNLWQANAEIQKLGSLGRGVKASDVEDVVVPKISENIFNLSEQVLKKDKKGAMSLIENLFADQSTDEKSTAIKIVALLSEQFRALLLVNLLQQKKYGNDKIAEALGWSSGRVFMVSKQTNLISAIKLKNILLQLLDIDLALKSSDVNAKLLIDQIVTESAA